jgi:hypothetical protein
MIFEYPIEIIKKDDSCVVELYFKMEGISVYSLIQKLAQYPSDAIVTIEDDSLVIRERVIQLNHLTGKNMKTLILSIRVKLRIRRH